jgi:hypothetical protein
VMMMEMQRLMMKGTMPCPPMIRVAARIMSSPKVPPVDLSGAVFLCFSKLCVSDLFAVCVR